MRCTEIIGLKDEAHTFLAENAKRTEVKICPTCHHQEGGQVIDRVYADAKDEGMFEDGPVLYEYELNDGSVVREVVQAVPWSSGPCIFLCLEKNGVRMFEWTEDEIERA